MKTYKTNSNGGWIVPANSRIHSYSDVPAHSEIGDGCLLGNRCHLGAYCRLGAGCRLGNGCELGTECHLGGRCHLGDGCSLGNRCHLGNLCVLGEGWKLGEGCVLGQWCKLPPEMELLGPMRIIKGICLSSAIGGRDQVFKVRGGDGTRAVTYGLTLSGRLLAAFDGEKHGEFLAPGGTEEFLQEIGGRLCPDPYMARNGMWLGGPAVAALKDLASRSAPSVWRLTETSGKVYIKPSHLLARLQALVEAANGPAYIPLVGDAH